MSKPWEKYKTAQAPVPTEADLNAGPWQQYNQSAPATDLVAEPAPEQEKPGLMSRVLNSAPVEYGLRALDYPGGLLRTGLAAVGSTAQGENVVDSEDFLSALKGQAPTSAEYLERMGVDEGPSATIPFTDKKVSLRDAEGLALDVGTDPLTLISKSVRGLRPAGVAMEEGGRSVYKSGLKKVDEKLAEKGAGDLSDELLKEGAVGTTKQLAKKAEKILRKAGDERAILYKKASDAGVMVDMAYPMKDAEKVIAKLAKDPGLRPMAEQFSELLNRYKESGKVDLATLSEWKTNLYNSLPASAYDVGGKLKGPAQEFKKALSNDFKKAIVEGGNKAQKGLGDKIDSLNETMQTVLESRKPMKAQIRRANTPNPVTAVDGIIGGIGLGTGNPLAAAGVIGLKKTAQAANTTLGRTAMGKGLIDLGKSGVPDALIRQGLIEAERRKRRGLLAEPGLIPLSDKDTP